MPRTGASSTIEMSPRARRRYDRKRRREQKSLDERCKQLAGPVTVTYLPGRDPGLGSDPGPKGAAEECSTERSRAPDRQPVAPVEGRAMPQDKMTDHGRESPGVIGKAVPQQGGEGAGSCLAGRGAWETPAMRTV